MPAKIRVFYTGGAELGSRQGQVLSKKGHFVRISSEAIQPEYFSEKPRVILKAYTDITSKKGIRWVKEFWY